MKIIFCNIAYLRYYDGRVAGELTPSTGGRWVKENEDAHEKWNFLNMDGKCYGYVQGLSDRMHIERLEGVSRSNATAEDVTVVWCALRGDKTVIVGWYEHATAYRQLQACFCTPLSGLERCFWFETNAENAYLLPENMRTYEIKRASQAGAGNGFGQYNYWYADSEFAQKNIVPPVIDYIRANKQYRINTQTSVFLDSGDTSPLTPEEAEYVENLSEDQNIEYLRYGYRVFAEKQDADSAYYIADALDHCHQYSLALPWFEKVTELDPTDISVQGKLAYLYQQCGMFDRSVALGKEMLQIPDLDETTRDEIYCLLADGCMYQNRMDQAIGWLDRILKESRDSSLIEYTKVTKEAWEGSLE